MCLQVLPRYRLAVFTAIRFMSGHYFSWLMLVENSLLLLILLGRYPCTDGVRIVGRWCSTPFREAKDKPDSVPI